jgi:Spy/CpxP family protein refolding chaperone
MKKRLLLAGLVLTFALSVSAYAQCPQKQAGCPLKEVVKKECPAVKCPPENCPQKLHRCPLKKTRHFKRAPFNKAPMEAHRYQGYVHRVQKNRATTYNALNLTNEQIKLREDMVRENTPIYNRKFAELTKESYKVKALKKAGASKKEIDRQKKVVKNTKKDIDKLLKEENKQYKKSLTREQRSKYNMIKKLEEKDYKDAANKKDYYKSNPQMVPFGDPKFLKPGPRPGMHPGMLPGPQPGIKPGPKPGEIPTPTPVLPPREIK